MLVSGSSVNPDPGAQVKMLPIQYLLNRQQKTRLYVRACRWVRRASSIAVV